MRRNNSPGLAGGEFIPKEVTIPFYEVKLKHFESVNLALNWLADNQEKEGYWDTSKYEGNGRIETNLATTAFCLLSFLANGHVDHVGKYRKNISSAISWLLAQQKEEGCFSGDNLTNGICLFALSEALSMGSKIGGLKEGVERLTYFILNQQSEFGGFTYDKPLQKRTLPNDDIITTGICMMGLKSSLVAGMQENRIKEAFFKCNLLLDEALYTNDNSESTKGESWYRIGIQGSGKSGGACQSVTMLLRQYIGWRRNEPWLIAASDSQIKNIPVQYKGLDVFRVYYNYFALFQQGGVYWSTWENKVSLMIANSQRNDGKYKGSWDPTGCSIDVGGRVLYTAMLASSLSYRKRWGVMQ